MSLISNRNAFIVEKLDSTLSLIQLFLYPKLKWFQAHLYYKWKQTTKQNPKTNKNKPPKPKNKQTK